MEIGKPNKTFHNYFKDHCEKRKRKLVTLREDIFSTLLKKREYEALNYIKIHNFWLQKATKEG